MLEEKVAQWNSSYSAETCTMDRTAQPTTIMDPTEPVSKED